MSAKIEWSYLRKNCTTCEKSVNFLEKAKVKLPDPVDARTVRISGQDALDLLSKVDRLIVAKGKKLVEINLKKERPDDESLLKLMLGPTGNLRAPSLRAGKVMLVGFSEEMYGQHLKS